MEQCWRTRLRFAIFVKYRFNAREEVDPLTAGKYNLDSPNPQAKIEKGADTRGAAPYNRVQYRP